MSLGALLVGQFDEDIAFSVDLLHLVTIEVRICCIFVLLTEVDGHIADGLFVSVYTP